MEIIVFFILAYLYTTIKDKIINMFDKHREKKYRRKLDKQYGHLTDEQRAEELASLERQKAELVRLTKELKNQKQELHDMTVVFSRLKNELNISDKEIELLPLMAKLYSEYPHLPTRGIELSADTKEAYIDVETLMRLSEDDVAKILKKASDEYNLIVNRARSKERTALNKIEKERDKWYAERDEAFGYLDAMHRKQLETIEKAGSNLKDLPHMANIVSEFITAPLEEYARILDWGNNKERTKKVASIRQIRAEAQALIERYKLAEYQLEYLKNLYPVLEEVLETEYSDLPKGELGELPSHDPTKDYLSKEEWDKLSATERNQLALDRYIEGHRKTKWQIGRDYELYIGYVYQRKGYTVDYFGSYMGMEDLGRDLIARKGDEVLIIQCKYWSSQKVIREKHITQLYGTMMCYCMEHNIPKEKVRAVFCTNISVSDKAKEFSEYLGVQLHDNIPLGNFPRIKCNIGKDENGAPTYIYHLPFDQQYDHAKIDSPGECFALTVAEAESKGFRRSYKWFGE